MKEVPNGMLLYYSNANKAQKIFYVCFLNYYLTATTYTVTVTGQLLPDRTVTDAQTDRQ